MTASRASLYLWVEARATLQQQNEQKSASCMIRANNDDRKTAQLPR